ncbi:structural cement protein Gp24 [Gibbsiella quercinecans]|uniref:structural cement protein Gp24 n=1 Tax=Gibbsiella quercinecans TaxID=929813 RepID=UPI00242E12CC|nr:hypothetical protein [Gibbsiella quercinecans]
MSLIKASYTVSRGQAYAGQIADTSLYNVDGACVVNSGVKVPVGSLVSVVSVQPVEGHKVVQVAADASKPLLGIAVMSHAYSPTGEYDSETAINVLTHGRVWALAESALTDAQAAYGAKVSFNKDGVVSAGGAINTDYTFTGEILSSENPDYKIVKLQLIQSGANGTEPVSGG